VGHSNQKRDPSGWLEQGSVIRHAWPISHGKDAPSPQNIEAVGLFFIFCFSSFCFSFFYNSSSEQAVRH